MSKAEKNVLPTGDDWRDALFLELVRRAILETFDEGPCRSEDEAAVLAFWKLLNPFGSEDRDRIEIPFLAEPDGESDPSLPPLPPRIRWLTAHVHPGEPLTPSADDLLLYDRLDLERGACVHFILDGVRVKKIR